MHAVFPDIFMSRWAIESWIIKWIYHHFTCQVSEEHRKSAKLDIQGDGGAIVLPFYFAKGVSQW
jgi:hypothetical protein